MRKLAIAFMLVAGVALSGSVIAANAPATGHHHTTLAKKSNTKHHPQKKTQHHKAAAKKA